MFHLAGDGRSDLHGGAADTDDPDALTTHVHVVLPPGRYLDRTGEGVQTRNVRRRTRIDVGADRTDQEPRRDDLAACGVQPPTVVVFVEYLTLNTCPEPSMRTQPVFGHQIQGVLLYLSSTGEEPLPVPFGANVNW